MFRLSCKHYFTAHFVVHVVPVLVGCHLFSFEDVYSVRLSYQLYESFDGRGLVITEATLLNAIKVGKFFQQLSYACDDVMLCLELSTC
jgi:hypothetical protein